MKHTQLFSIVLVKEHSDTLQELADAQHKTKSALFRDWLVEKYQEFKKQEKLQEEAS